MCVIRAQLDGTRKRACVFTPLLIALALQLILHKKFTALKGNVEATTSVPGLKRPER